jgi:hypothetical protein
VWALMSNGKTMFAMPRIGILNHIIHDRGRLSVYLWMNKAPVPSIYGPSGNEGRMQRNVGGSCRIVSRISAGRRDAE